MLTTRMAIFTVYSPSFLQQDIYRAFRCNYPSTNRFLAEINKHFLTRDRWITTCCANNPWNLSAIS